MVKVQRLNAGGIVPTYRCTAACRHCLYGCSGKSDGRYIDGDESARLCRTLVGMGCRSVHIGGGEPFLQFDALLQLVREVNASGLHLEYIETNAYWCKPADIADAADKLARLREAGAECLLISVDPFHLEYVPLERPLALAELCRRVGMDYFVWQQRYVSALSKLDRSRVYKRQELEEILGKNYVFDIANSYGLSYNGRALNIAREYLPKKPHADYLHAPPCRELLGTNHYHADYNCNFIPPGCTGIAVALEDLHDISAEKYPVFTTLAEQGVAALLQYAQGAGFTPSPEGYVSKCDLCYACRKYLLTNKPSRDIYPEHYYQSNF